MCRSIGGITEAEFSRVKRVLERDAVKRMDGALMELGELAVSIGLGHSPRRCHELLLEAIHALREARTTTVALAWPSYTVTDFLEQEDPDHDPQCCEHERPPLLHEDVDAAEAVHGG